MPIEKKKKKKDRKDKNIVPMRACPEGARQYCRYPVGGGSRVAGISRRPERT